LLSQGLCSLQNKIGKEKADVFSELFVFLFLKEAVVFLFLKYAGGSKLEVVF